MAEPWCSRRGDHSVFRRFHHWLCSLALLAFGCASDGDKLEADDRGVFFPTLRASFDVDRQGPASFKRGPAEYSMSWDASIDAEVSRGEGETTDRVDSGDEIRIGDLRIDGPADLEIDHSIALASVAFAATLRSQRGLLLRGFAGVGYSRLDLDIDTGAQKQSEEISAVGPMIGGRIGWYAGPTLGVYAQASQRIGFPSEFQSVIIDQLELGFEIFPTTGLALFAAWRGLSYEGDGGGDHWHHGHDSDLDLDLSGPVAGLSLSF